MFGSSARTPFFSHACEFWSSTDRQETKLNRSEHHFEDFSDRKKTCKNYKKTYHVSYMSKQFKISRNHQHLNVIFGTQHHQHLLNFRPPRPPKAPFKAPDTLSQQDTMWQAAEGQVSGVGFWCTSILGQAMTYPSYPELVLEPPSLKTMSATIIIPHIWTHQRARTGLSGGWPYAEVDWLVSEVYPKEQNKRKRTNCLARLDSFLSRENHSKPNLSTVYTLLY